MEFSERMAYSEHDPWFQEHIARYHKVTGYPLGPYVLDIACGSGFGSKLVAENGSSVMGVDQNVHTIEINKENFSGIGNLNFQTGDAEKIAFPPNTFSSVISFETIEHLNNPEDFLIGVKKVLRSDGFFFLSTPNALITKPVNGVPKNPYHIKEYTPEELKKLLSEYFEIISIFGQVVSADFKLNYFWNPSAKRYIQPKYYLWAFLNRLNRHIATLPNEISNAIFKSPLYPDREFWVFSEEIIDEAHDLFIICRKRATSN